MSGVVSSSSGEEDRSSGEGKIEAEKETRADKHGGKESRGHWVMSPRQIQEKK